MSTMRDSIDARLIPRDTDVVVGIAGGRFTWVPSWWDGSNGFDLFPDTAVKLVIVPFATLAGDILDVESGDALPAEAPAWCQRFFRPGRRRPTLYCSRDTWPVVIAALRAAGFGPVPDVDWWIATLDGTTDVAVPDGGRPPVAIQVRDTGPYDDSLVLDPTWPGGTMSEADVLNAIGECSRAIHNTFDLLTNTVVPELQALQATVDRLQAAGLVAHTHPGGTTGPAQPS